MRHPAGNRHFYKLSLFIETLRGQELTQKQLSRVFTKICKFWQAGKINEMELSELCDRVILYYKNSKDSRGEY